MVCRLLVRVRQLDQRRFRPCAAEERDPSRQQAAPRVTHRHLNRRKARRRRKELAVVAVRCVEIANQPRRIAPRRVNKRVDLLRLQRLQNGRANLLAVLAFRFARGRVRSIFSFLFRLLEPPLHAWMKAT